MALLTLTQQNSIKPISQNWANHIKIAGGVTNFKLLQTEVENKELKNLLGNALLYDIQQNTTDPGYVKLLDGTTFLDCDDNTIEFQGIRFQLAYMNWSKYVGESHLSDTFTGMVQKSRNESTALSSGDIKRTQLDAREIALQDFEIMKLYLNDNETIYPLWITGKTKKIYTPKFTGIKRTIL